MTLSRMPTNANRLSNCYDQLVDEYTVALTSGGGDFEMLRTLKLIRSIVVITAVSAIALYALYLGADPTVIAVLSLPTLGAYAGAEAIDYAALLKAYRKTTHEGTND